MLQPSVVEVGERDVLGRTRDQRRRAAARTLLAQREHRVEVRRAAAARARGRRAAALASPRRSRARAGRSAGVQVREPLEHRELRAGFLEVSRRGPARRVRGRRAAGRLGAASLVGPDVAAATAAAPRTRMWSIPGPGAEKPSSSAAQRPAPRTLKSPREHDASRRARRAPSRRPRARRSSASGSAVGRGAGRVQVGDDEPPSRRSRGRPGRRGAPSPTRAARARSRPSRAPARGGSAGVEHEHRVREHAEPRGEQDRVRLAGERRAEQPGWIAVSVRPSSAGDRQRAERRRLRRRRRGASSRSTPSSRRAPTAGSSWRQSTSGRSALASRTISSRCASRPGGCGVAVEEVPAPDQHGGAYCTTRRCASLLADPAAFTPQYDHELAAGARARRRGRRARHLALSLRRGARAGRLPSAARRSTRSRSRLFRRSRLRLPLKALEHPLGMARLARAAARRRPPAVARRAAARRAAAPRCGRRWSSPPTTCSRAGRRRREISGGALLERFDRVVVHTRARPRRRWPSSASRPSGCASSPTPSSAATRRAPTTGARCSASA